MSTKSLLFLLALSGFSLPAVGCGGHQPGVAEGVNEEPEPLTKEQEDVERANNRKARGG